MKKLFALVLLLLAVLIPISTFPTCIVIIKSIDGNVYIAADSSRTLSWTSINDAKGLKSQPTYVEGCKLEQIGKILFAIGGHLDTYIQQIAERQFKWYKSIDDIELFTVDSAQIRLQEEIETEQKYDTSRYQRYLKLKELSEIAFVYYSKRSRIDSYFFILTESNGKPLVTIEPNLDAQGVVGIEDHLNPDSMEYRNLSKLYRDKTVDLVLNMVQLEASHHEEVHAPFELVELTTQGIFLPLSPMRNCDSLRALHPEVYPNP